MQAWMNRREVIAAHQASIGNPKSLFEKISGAGFSR
jgi:hypothetical protein